MGARLSLLSRDLHVQALFVLAHVPHVMGEQRQLADDLRGRGIPQELHALGRGAELVRDDLDGRALLERVAEGDDLPAGGGRRGVGEDAPGHRVALGRRQGAVLELVRGHDVDVGTGSTGVAPGKSGRKLRPTKALVRRVGERRGLPAEGCQKIKLPLSVPSKVSVCSF